MQTKFSPSINIERDWDKELSYVPTNNSIQIFNQIKNNFKSGIHAFNIIGTYGTGKSSFILALEKNLKREKEYFEPMNGQFNDVNNFEFINIVGEYKSIFQSFADHFKLKGKFDSKKNIISEIRTKYKKLYSNNSCLVIVIDEFGKFLEYASKNNTEKELCFIQQLAEFANDTNKNIILITVLHQSFEAYARKLDRTQKQEWEKVKGRLKDLTFNEPVEQLLLLAAENISKKNFNITDASKLIKLIKIIEKSNTFTLRNEISEELAAKLYPLDLLAASVLTQSLQVYGQNERSLFTFLESNDNYGINQFKGESGSFYNLTCVYDYLIHNYYSFLSTRNNPHYIQWAAIKSSLERAEAEFDQNYKDAQKLVKVIGLLSIFISESAIVNQNLLNNYCKLSLGINDASSFLKQLENKKIVRYINFKDRFVLFEGTDLDIELSLMEASEKIDPINDVVSSLKKCFDFPYIPAKSVHFNFGTPRFFEFVISNNPVAINPIGEIDGIINLVFSEVIKDKKNITEYSKNNPAILYGIYQNTEKIKEILNEIEKVNYVLNHIADDRIAERELKNILTYHIHELNDLVINDLYTHNKNIIWLHDNKVIEFKSGSSFNNFLSDICAKTYSATPIFKNELINKHKTPAVITTARKNFFKSVIQNWDKENLNFDDEKFPPEKTIYLSLLKKTGIHRIENGMWNLFEPEKDSFKSLWSISEEFLNGAQIVKKNLQDLFEILSNKPLKLKNGFIEFWIPLFLFIKREEYALYSENGFIPSLDINIIELLLKNPRKFQIKAFNIEGIKLDLFNKYRTLINKNNEYKISSSSFIETIKPFLMFYKGLPAYSKRTKRLSKSSLKLREAIASATDPEKTFFEDFPQALGYVSLNLKESDNVLSDYIFQLQSSISEIRNCFEELLNRIENYLVKTIGVEDTNFPEYKNKLRERFRSIKESLLLNHQKVFYLKILSELNDRKSWLGSLVQAVLEKPIEEMRDEEEELVLEKISSNIHELDNLCDISKIEFDKEKEEILKLEVTNLELGVKSKIIRLPKIKNEQMKELKQKIRPILTKDESVNLVALTKVIEEIQNGKS